MVYLFAAYAAIFALLCLYLLRLDARLRRLERELARQEGGTGSGREP